VNIYIYSRKTNIIT